VEEVKEIIFLARGAGCGVLFFVVIFFLCRII